MNQFAVLGVWAKELVRPDDDSAIVQGGSSSRPAPATHRRCLSPPSVASHEEAANNHCDDDRFGRRACSKRRSRERSTSAISCRFTRSLTAPSPDLPFADAAAAKHAADHGAAPTAAKEARSGARSSSLKQAATVLLVLIIHYLSAYSRTDFKRSNQETLPPKYT